MEEVKVFKALVHKETGEYASVDFKGVSIGLAGIPQLYDSKMTIKTLSHWYQNDLKNDFELKELALLSLEEYQRLKKGE